MGDFNADTGSPKSLTKNIISVRICVCVVRIRAVYVFVYVYVCLFIHTSVFVLVCMCVWWEGGSVALVFDWPGAPESHTMFPDRTTRTRPIWKSKGKRSTYYGPNTYKMFS